MIKIIVIALVCGLIVIYLKNIQSELYSLALLGSGIIITFLGLNYLIETVEFIKTLLLYSNIDGEYIQIIFKITAIGILIEFGAGTLEDMGLSSLSNKLVFVGKVIIFCTSIPVFYALINIISGFLL